MHSCSECLNFATGFIQLLRSASLVLSFCCCIQPTGKVSALTSHRGPSCQFVICTSYSWVISFFFWNLVGWLIQLYLALRPYTIIRSKWNVLYSYIASTSLCSHWIVDIHMSKYSLPYWIHKLHTIWAFLYAHLSRIHKTGRCYVSLTAQNRTLVGIDLQVPKCKQWFENSSTTFDHNASGNSCSLEETLENSLYMSSARKYERHNQLLLALIKKNGGN